MVGDRVKILLLSISNTINKWFRNDFREISHRYPTGFGQINFVEGNILSNQTKFAVLSRGPRLSNSLLSQ